MCWLSLETKGPGDYDGWWVLCYCEGTSLEEQSAVSQQPLLLNDLMVVL